MDGWEAEPGFQRRLLCSLLDVQMRTVMFLHDITFLLCVILSPMSVVLRSIDIF